MPARLKLYLDKDCTKELYRDELGRFFYRFHELLSDGTYNYWVDGNSGTNKLITLFIKNIGSRAALNVKLLVKRKEDLTIKNIFSKTEYIVGDIPVDGVNSITLDFSISPWTASQVNETEIVLDYYSLPDITEEVNPIGKHFVLQKDTHLGFTKDSAVAGLSDISKSEHLKETQEGIEYYGD